MKNTALTQKHIDLGARMVEFAGFNMPLEYSGITKEHLAVRNAAGLFDASHMGEFIVNGKQAKDLLQYVTTNDVSKLIDGQAQYTCMPNGKGGIIDDIIIFKHDIERYMLVVNASNKEKDLAWIMYHNSFDAKIEDISYQMSLIALQGPKASDILNSLVNFSSDNIKNFNFVVDSVAAINNVIISATGYTGAGGFELYCRNEDAPKLWDKLMEIGNEYGILPAGLAARDTLRLEMGYCLYGNDIDESTSPIEAGLGWIVKTNKKEDFIDKALLISEKEQGTKRRLIGFEMVDRGIPRKDYEILDKDNKVIGNVTSGTMSPISKKGIGMGYIQKEFSDPQSEIFISVRNKSLKACVVKPPFIK
ncbi:MAG: glycine cleavage system aminomethyltransferase GcvT [Bacteroidales bacterium]|nr:glycine cleavage system aminomethyltransferase GcvT [Bacteroidales bacterium]